MKKLFVYSLLIVMSYQCYAREVRDITYTQFINSGLPSDHYPQLFVFNKQGVLIHYNKGIDRTLKGRLKRTSAYHNANNIVPAFENIIKHQDNSADFTVYTITKLEQGGCPPCIKQEAIITKVIASTPNKTIKSVVLNIDSSDVNSVLTEEERAKRFPNQD